MQEEMESIDDADFSILKVIRDAGEPLWKKRVYTLLHDRQDELPMVDSVSEQTVGRRIDDLVNVGMLETVIIDPDEMDRELAIGYGITDDGREVIREKRRAYLRDIVRRDIFKDFRDEDVPQGPLLSAIEDEFDLGGEPVNQMSQQFSSVELAAMLALYYIEIEAQELLSETLQERIRRVARGELTMEEAVNRIE